MALLEKAIKNKTSLKITYLSRTMKKISQGYPAGKLWERWDLRVKPIRGLLLSAHCETNSGLSASTGYWR